jgi:hypothetical protein
MQPKIVESAAYLKILKTDKESGYNDLAIIIFKDGGLSELFYNKEDAGSQMGIALIDGRLEIEELLHIQAQIKQSNLIPCSDKESDEAFEKLNIELMESLIDNQGYIPKSEEDAIIIRALFTDQVIYEQRIN